MLKTFERDAELVAILSGSHITNENSIVEYKLKPHSKNRPCELVKDVLALLNAYDRPDEDRWLIFGVDNHTRTPLGFSKEEVNYLDDANYQQLLCSAITPRPVFEFLDISAEDVIGEKGKHKHFAAFYIPHDYVGKPFELAKCIEDKEPGRNGKICCYGKGMSFVRIGSSTEPLTERHREEIRKLLNRSSYTAEPYYAFLETNHYASSIDCLRLLGSWDENNEADRLAVSSLCGKPYPEAIRELTNDLYAGRFTLSGSIWHVADRMSALASVGVHLTGNYLKSLVKPLVDIVSSVDQMYAMPEAQRIMANVQNVSRGCSEAIRTGVASLCALIGNNLDSLPNCPKRDVEALLYEVMSSVLCSDYWEVLASSDCVEYLFAQASPSIYLSCIERGMNEHGAIEEFLGQQTGGFFPTYMGQGLISGIRLAAMREENLSRAISLLELLAKFTNHAKDAVVAILLPWHPQTDASVSIRKGMGRHLSRSSEQPMWEAFLDLLPNATQSIDVLQRPGFMDVADYSRTVDLSEYWDISRDYCSSALSAASSNPVRLLDVANKIVCFNNAGMMEEFCGTLSGSCLDLDELQRYRLWSSLLSYINRCNKYSNAKWVPNSGDLNKLRVLAEAVKPDDAYYSALRNCTLADYDLVGGYKGYEQTHKEAVKQRAESLETLVDSSNLSVVRHLLTDGAKGSLIGGALATIELSNEAVKSLLVMIEGVNEHADEYEMIREFVYEGFSQSGWSWIDALPLDGLSHGSLSELYAILPLTAETWARAEDALGEDVSLFWEKASGLCDFKNTNEAEHCVKELLRANRIAAATHVLWLAIEDGYGVDPGIVSDVLEATTTADQSSLDEYQIGNLLDYLEKKAPNDQLWNLEFRFARLLEERPDAYLYKQLSKCPELFIEVIKLAYGREEDEAALSGYARWMIISSVFGGWRICPGQDDLDTFDDDRFADWVDIVRGMADDQRIAERVESHIGQNLFYAPQGPEGLALPRAVAEFLESSSGGRDGYYTEAFNSRKAHIVDMSGKEEDDIAAGYESKAVTLESSGYARCGSLMRVIAKAYRREAEENREEGARLARFDCAL